MRVNRLNEMEQYVLRNGTASLEDLADTFQISLNTVRRDVDVLLERGSICKTYGGVVSLESAGPVPMAVRASKNKSGKRKIGLLASDLVRDGQTIFLDSGSTVLGLLPYLGGRRGITVVTHSLAALYEASRYPNLAMIALSGIYSPPTNSYVGDSTLRALERISVDTAFVAATGVSLDRGLTNATSVEAEIKRRVARRAKNVVLLADHTKFGSVSAVPFYDFDCLSAVVTDEAPSAPYLKVMERRHIQLLCG